MRSLLAWSCVAVVAQGMDLPTETACWAPIAADSGAEYSASCAKWYLDDHDFLTTRDRLDGLRVVQRRTSQLDGQFSLGYLSYDGHDVGPYLSGGTWKRAHLRVGTDPLAESFHPLLATAGVGYGKLPWWAVSCDAGYSSERGTVASVDAWLMLLHGAVERDSENGAMRLGVGLRMPGATSEWSGAVVCDYVRGWSTDGGTGRFPRAASSAVASATLAWSPVNHLLVTGMLTAASNAWLDGHRDEARIEAALGFGAGF